MRADVMAWYIAIPVMIVGCPLAAAISSTTFLCLYYGRWPWEL
jgi:hypothetical protein